MLGLGASPILKFPSKFHSLSPILQHQNHNFPSISQSLKSQPQNLDKRKQFQVYAENGNNVKKNKENRNGIPAEDSGNVDEGTVKNERLRFNFRWTDLLLDPNPDNIVAVGLTGLLTWASVQVLWQLFIISAAILLAALKYTLVAALLVFILITLL